MDGTLYVPTLETPRLILRQLTLDDAPDYFEFSSDPEVTRFIMRPTHDSIEMTRQRLEEVLAPEFLAVHKQWGMVLKDGGKLIGTCGLFVESKNDKRAGMGYTLNRAYWSRGYTTEAVRAMIDYGFEQEEYNRLEAMCFLDNFGSARVMEKAGMSYEGILRQYMFIKGEYKDLKVYSIIRDEWAGARG
jgi:[ribosomal protein S5]-alanine N-acetyltransferase